MSNKEVSFFFTGFFIGALAGGAAALLLAPQSGEETRTLVRERTIELREKAEATYTEVLERLEGTAEEIRKRTEEISAKVDEAIAQGRQELTRIGKKGEETPPAEEAAEEASSEA